MRNNHRQKRIQFGQHFLPWEGRTTHFFCVGATRSGKTILVRLLLQSVVPHIVPGSKMRLVVYDNKSEMYSTLAGMSPAVRIKSLHPFDERSWAWDMAANCSDTTAKQYGKVLIPDQPGEKDPFWTKAARRLLSGVMISFHKNSPAAWTLRDVLLACLSKKRLRAILGRDWATRSRLSVFEEERLAASVMETLTTAMEDYEPVAALWHRAKRSLSLEEWLGEESILILGHSDKYSVAMDPVNRCIIARLTDLLLEQPDTDVGGTFVVIDEARELGRLGGAGSRGGLRSLMNRGGGKQISVLIALQDIDGFMEAYGTLEAREIIGQCAHRLYARLQNPATAGYCSQCVGEEEVIEAQVSVGPDGQASVTYIRKRQPLLMPSEFLTPQIPQTDRENGLTYWAQTPYVSGVYCATIPGEELFNGMLLPVSDKVPNLIRRPQEHEELLDWTPEDLMRLRLPPEVLEDDEAAQTLAAGQERWARERRKESPKRSLDDIHPMEG